MIPVLAHLLEALAPRCCAGCDRPCADVLCEACAVAAMALPRPAPRASAHATLTAAFPHEPPVRRMVHAAKYRGHREAGRLLGVMAAERLVPALLARSGAPDVVVPVPLSQRRRRERGHNQAEPPARALATLAGVAVSGHLVRPVHRRSQVGRGGAERRAAPAGVFAWQGPSLHARSVWLVDDVLTTGATLVTAAAVLQQAGARRIEAVAVTSSAPGRE